ncbi:hypothetical protein H6G81_19325 [Scytonema hofmannii FACHB-248]|uniref:Uncharacterized protein n=1 Tax=Scytonema hofmannii FACHB-248 TaxID=1842502 RepID=A0ABR8GU73_9CYAN|nr:MULTISPECIES: hypothetical protein [Nostocales]MBD2606624.1 hypothetical protein [Scytonema hofmannii FACHB-248]
MTTTPLHSSQSTAQTPDTQGRFGRFTEKHAATLTKGQIGVLHGAMSYLLQRE